MAKNVRISDELYALAQVESRLQDRSMAQQLEHWAKRGMAAAEVPDTRLGTVSALDAAVAMTRRLDSLDVLGGNRDAEASHLIPRAAARQSQRTFPARYQKS